MILYKGMIMRYFSLLVLLSLMGFMPFSTYAQSAGDIDIEALGQPVVDDTLDLYDRYVYINQDAISSNVSLGKSILSDQEILDYITKAISDVLTMDASDLVEKIDTAKGYFTDSGYDQYLATVRNAGLKETLTAQNYSLRTIVAGQAELFSKGIDSENRYRWGILAPIIMTYALNSDPNQGQSFDLILETEITRMAINQPGDQPIAIDYWVLKEKPETTEE